MEENIESRIVLFEKYGLQKCATIYPVTALRSILSESHRYKTYKGEISLLHPCHATMGLYEIYAPDSDIIYDIERYDTLEKAISRIKELLL